MASAENEITKKIQLAAASRRTVLFRNNTGKLWAGEVVKHPNCVTIYNPRPVDAGLCVGSSDLIGWRVYKVQAADIGKELAIFTAIEVKTKTGRVSGRQQNFIDQILKSGGIAGVARSGEDAINIIDSIEGIAEDDLI